MSETAKWYATVPVDWLALYRRLRVVAGRRCGNRDCARDLAQETLCRLFQSRTFDPPVGCSPEECDRRIMNFARGIMRYVLLEDGRKPYRYREIVDDEAFQEAIETSPSVRVDPQKDYHTQLLMDEIPNLNCKKAPGGGISARRLRDFKVKSRRLE